MSSASSEHNVPESFFSLLAALLSLAPSVAKEPSPGPSIASVHSPWSSALGKAPSTAASTTPILSATQVAPLNIIDNALSVYTITKEMHPNGIQNLAGADNFH